MILAKHFSLDSFVFYYEKQYAIYFLVHSSVKINKSYSSQVNTVDRI